MRSIFFILMLLLSLLLSAQIQWQDDGVPLRIAQNLSFSETIDCVDGNLFITWSETRNESRGVYAQKIDNDGNLLWDEEGLEIVNANNSQRNVKAIATDDNCIILTWKDRRNPDVPELRIQKIDADGNFLWGDEGLILCANLHLNSNVNLVPDSAHGIFVFWYIMYSGGGTYATHILADGSFAPGWSSTGNLILENSIYDAVSDNNGNLVLTTVINDELVIQKMDENGNFLWGTTGQSISNYDSYSFVGKIVPDNDDSYYVVWRDRRVSDGIYCQLIDQNGNKMWNEDTELITGYDYYYRHSINASDNDLIVCWIEENNPFQIIVQKIDNTGTKQWGMNGVVASGNENSYVQGLISDSNNGCWISWMSGSDINKVYVQHLDSTGSKLLEENGLAVCMIISYQFYPSINAAPDNKFYVSWIDRRDKKAGVYCQIVDNAGNLILNPEGVKIIDGISEDILDLEVITNTNGIYYLWRDNRPCGHNEIYLQSIDQNGNILLPENGVSIIPDFTGYARSYEYEFNENTNMLNIVWENSENSQIYVQALDTSGNLLWPESGIMLNSPYQFNSDPKLSQKGEYSYVGWTANENSYPPDYHVIAQRLDQNGNLLWGTEGIVLNSVYENDFISFLAGMCYFWLAYDNNQYYLYAKLLDENGNPAPGWNDNGLLISNLAGQFWLNEIDAQVFDTTTGYLAYWIDEQVLKGQLISEEGAFMWQEGGLSIIDSGHALTGLTAIFDMDQGMTYMVWADSYPSFDNSIYTQKVDINGNEIWADNGIFISEGMNHDIAKVGDYILIVWEYKTEDYTHDIKAQLINLDGEVQWEQDGITICDAPHDQLDPKVEVIDEENFVIAWRDNRSGQYGENEILFTSGYTQKIYVESTYTPDDILKAINTELHQNYPNPFNPVTTIRFNLNRELNEPDELAVTIYNVKGQKVKTLPISPSQSRTGFVVWDGTDNSNQPVSSGVYLYQLKSGKFEKTKKCMLMK